MIPPSPNTGKPGGAKEYASTFIATTYDLASQARTSRRWTDWRELLSADLPARWNNAQIKLITGLASDPTVRDGLLSAVIDADELVSRGRWVNTAKLVADEFPDLVATRLAEVSSQGGDDHNRPNRRSVGARATLSSRIARRLAKPVRQ
ncbi:hypothetical protein ACQPZ2_11345 [Nocardia pseudovaccinii]|uniref:hypothetical protein n=1 Tax=Nocardia pseudovaccinii TaxID=189540 RepID=UPI003D94B6E1